MTRTSCLLGSVRANSEIRWKCHFWETHRPANRIEPTDGQEYVRLALAGRVLRPDHVHDFLRSRDYPFSLPCIVVVVLIVCNGTRIGWTSVGWFCFIQVNERCCVCSRLLRVLLRFL